MRPVIPDGSINVTCRRGKEQLLQGMELQEKEAQKRLRHR